MNSFFMRTIFSYLHPIYITLDQSLFQMFKDNKTNIFNFLVFVFLIISSLGSCKKENPPVVSNPTDTTTTDTGFVKYTIRQGQQYCDQNTLKLVSVSSMKFDVVFDSSAIYSTVDPNNQFDINKLYGFSEGFNHQYNSARFGWRWSDDSLRLFGYVYNNGIRLSQEISSIVVGDTISCNIELQNTSYIFRAGQKQISIPRTATGAIASGYQLYPYFGGDETAPQLITIRIKERL